jgi:hypothetical protein
MELTTLAQWTQIISSLAVLATVIYLAIEIKQNTVALRSQTHATLFEGSQAELMVAVHNPQIISDMLKDEVLAEGAYVRLSAYLTAFLRAREFTWLQYRQGVVGEDVLDTERAIIRNTINVRRNRLWWQEVGRGAFGEKFVSFVDSLIQDGRVAGEWYVGSLGWESAGKTGLKE